MQQRGLDSTRQKRARARFLRALAGQAAGSVPKAAKLAGVSRTLPHSWACRDPDFAAKMAEARVVGERVRLDEIEAEIERRAVAGYEEAVYQKGIRVGTVRRFSDLLLMFRAKKLNPAYRDNHAPFIEASTAARVRLMQVRSDGTEYFIEIGPGATPALPAPSESKVER